MLFWSFNLSKRSMVVSFFLYPYEKAHQFGINLFSFDFPFLRQEENGAGCIC